MKSIYFYFIILLFSVNNLNSQKRFDLGVSLIYQDFDHTTFNDNGNLIKTSNRYSLTLVQPELDVKFGVRLYKNFYCELSGRFKKYPIGYYNKLSSTTLGVFTNVLWTFQIPIKLKYKYNFIDHFSIVPNLGVNYCNLTSQISYFSSMETEPEYSTTEYYNSSIDDNFILYSFGTDFEYNLSNRHSISFEFNYFYGQKELYSEKIDYVITNDPTHYSAEIISKGIYFSFGIGYRYYFNIKNYNH